ncbi:MAG: metallophosphoesterase [Bacteroidota bacterium]
MKRHLIFLILFLRIISPTSATTITGYVFADKNNNGQQDGQEPGVANVAVSNQFRVVTTDSRGFYSLEGEDYGIVMISVPTGYKTPEFWKTIPEGQSNPTINFALASTPPVTSFSFVHASDTHISENSLDRMNKFKSAVDAAKPDLVLVTGDLVRDALRVPEETARKYYELYKTETEKFTPPVWNVPGNHEIFGIERHQSLVSKKHALYGRKMYRHYLGPDYYSFNYGGVHFIALNDVDFDDLWYYGHVDSVQMQWLKQDLSLIAPATPVVTFHHMALYSPGLSLDPFEEHGAARSVEIEKGKLQYRHLVSNAMDVMMLMQNNNYVLSLAGHFHMRQVCRFEVKGRSTRFEQAACVIEGYPLGAFQVPAGITVYHVKNGVIDEGRFIEF